MAETDIRIRNVEVSFSLEMFRMPLNLSTGPIYGCEYASAVVCAENRLGQMAEGRGGIFLSDLWSFPTAALTHEEKAECMKETVRRMAALLRAVDGFHDPMQLSHRIDQELRNVGEGWKGVYPSDFLAEVKPKTEIWVQHVIGVADPLTEADLTGFNMPPDDLPVTLTDWITKERIRRFKIKLKGDDIAASVAFIGRVYKVAAEQLTRQGIAAGEMKLALDPNEAFPSPEPVEALLARLREHSPEAFEAIEYVEQPIPRDLSRFAFSMRGIDAYKPVIMDESLDDIVNLRLCGELGWSGIALKTCKGQSHSIAAYCWGKRNGMHVTVQDLTNAGLSFVHSANLWSRLELSADSLEYNSRQFAPFCFQDIKERYPDLFRVADGRVSPRQIGGIGLY